MSKTIRIAIAAAFGIAIAMPALAEDATGDAKKASADKGSPDIAQNQQGTDMSSSGTYYYRSGRLDYSMAGSSNEFGSPAGDMASDREIHLGANGGNIGVAHGETVKFMTSDGREFRWRFDTLKRVTSFPLASIAPGNLPGKVYVGGDINNNG